MGRKRLTRKRGAGWESRATGLLPVFLSLVLSACSDRPPPCEACPSAAGGPSEARLQAAIARVFPALVRLHVVVATYDDGREKKYEGTGSGFIISPEGHIVTNHHVAGNAKWICGTLADKTRVLCDLVGTDALSDIAVIKIRPGELKKLKGPVPMAHWGDSDQLQVGDQVMAMGSPASLSQSVTLGIVSNTAMMMPELQWHRKLVSNGEAVGSLVRWIGHDAAIYEGNSGGPLVNVAGEVVGVNEISIGLGGAIPSSLARQVAEDLIAGGEVRRSWLGLGVQPLLDSSGLEEGALVGGVIKGSPADQAGLKPGEVILSYDGHPVTVRFEEQLPLFNRLVLGTPVGKAVSLKVQPAGGGATKVIKVTTTARGKAQADEEELLEWGMTARDLTRLAAIALERERTDGVYVSTVRPGGPCSEAKPAIQRGDLIAAVGGKPVKSLAELQELTAKLITGQDRPVPTVVTYEREKQRYLTVVQVGRPEEMKRPPRLRKAWFPAATQVLTRQLAESLGLKGTKGVRITQVYKGMAAEKAGLQVGDMLTHVDGDPIEATNPEDTDVFPFLIRQKRVNQTHQFTVLRESKKLTVPVVLPPEPQGADEVDKLRVEALQLMVREISPLDRATEQVPEEVTGLWVASVDPGGAAALSQVAVGDILLSFGGRATESVAALKEALQEAKKKQVERVVLFLRRAPVTFFREVKPDWPREK